MKLKRDFRLRLENLRKSIDSVLESDSLGSCNLGSLFPRLFAVYAYLWMHDHKILKK